MTITRRIMIAMFALVRVLVLLPLLPFLLVFSMIRLYVAVRGANRRGNVLCIVPAGKVSK